MHLRLLLKLLAQFFQLIKQLEIQNLNKKNNKEELKKLSQELEEDEYKYCDCMYFVSLQILMNIYFFVFKQIEIVTNK